MLSYFQRLAGLELCWAGAVLVAAAAGAVPDWLFVLPQVPVAQCGADDAVQGEVAASEAAGGAAQGQAAAAAMCQWQ